MLRTFPQNPAGPFSLQPGVIALDSVGGDYHGSGDMNVFVDAADGGDGSAYIIFTSGYSPPVRSSRCWDTTVELSTDYQSIPFHSLHLQHPVLLAAECPSAQMVDLSVAASLAGRRPHPDPAAGCGRPQRCPWQSLSAVSTTPLRSASPVSPWASILRAFWAQLSMLPRRKRTLRLHSTTSARSVERRQ